MGVQITQMGVQTIPLTWRNAFRRQMWGSMLVFFIAFVLFFVAYVGNNWWVVPKSNMHYPPDPSYSDIKMGLFWMCALGHCKYDLKVDYMVVAYLPFKSIQDAFQNYRTLCMVIITIAAIFCLIALALNLIFLSGFSISHFMGFAAGATEIIAGIIALIGIIVYASKFRGPTDALPFGWSYWLMVGVLIVLIFDGIYTIVLASRITHVIRTGVYSKQSAAGQPLAMGY